MILFSNMNRKEKQRLAGSACFSMEFQHPQAIPVSAEKQWNVRWMQNQDPRPMEATLGRQPATPVQKSQPGKGAVRLGQVVPSKQWKLFLESYIGLFWLKVRHILKVGYV
jgi:hypothetical protein